MSSSPLVRRLRLGAALRDLRREAGISAEELGRRLGWSRLIITRLEADDERKPDVGKVMSILDKLGLHEDEERYRTLVRVARDAAETGWWEGREYAGMGARQARTANLEQGAETIREYHMTLPPGLVQTEEFAREYGKLVVGGGSTVNLEASLKARLRRKAQITAPNGSEYELIVEEQAIRRVSVAAPIMLGQLEHLMFLAERDNVTVQVLPVDARLQGLQPRTPFGLYAYSDPGDPVVVAVDTVAKDLLHIDPDDVDPYVQLFQRLHVAALSPAQSTEYIKAAASSLAAA